MSTTLDASEKSKGYDYYVDALYLALLQRSPDDVGREAWRRDFTTIEAAAEQIMTSEEYRLSRAAMERVPEAAMVNLDPVFAATNDDSSEVDAGLLDARLRVLACLTVASIHRSQRLHQIRLDAQAASDNEVVDTLAHFRSESETLFRSLNDLHGMIDTVRNEQATRARGVQSRFEKEHIALSLRLASIERRLYEKPSIDSGNARVFYVGVQGVEVVHGPYGSFMVLAPDLIGGEIARGNFWDPHLKPYMDRSADKKKVAVDAGAFIGFHTVYLSSLFKEVHSFEPQKRCHDLMVGNAALNNCRNVVAHNCALFDVNSWMTVAADADQQIPVPRTDGSIDYTRIGNAAALTFSETGIKDPNRVEAKRLDEFGLTNVGFIKIDTQGSDLRVLLGAKETIAKSRPVIALEFEGALASRLGATWDDFTDFFKQMRYSVREVAHTGPNQWDHIAEPID